MSDFQFEVWLIKANRGQKDIEANCTYITKKLWFFEGDKDCLEGDYEVLGSGIVGSLGGLSQKKLVEIAEETFCEFTAARNGEDVETIPHGLCERCNDADCGNEWLDCPVSGARCACCWKCEVECGMEAEEHEEY